jgi:hypothetical protein
VRWGPLLACQLKCPSGAAISLSQKLASTSLLDIGASDSLFAICTLALDASTAHQFNFLRLLRTVLCHALSRRIPL